MFCSLDAWWSFVFRDDFCNLEIRLNEVSKFIEGDYYLSPEGFRIFTAQYLKRRGYCCKSGCKHCPYGYDKKTGLIKK